MHDKVEHMQDGCGGCIHTKMLLVLGPDGHPCLCHRVLKVPLYIPIKTFSLEHIF